VPRCPTAGRVAGRLHRRTGTADRPGHPQPVRQVRRRLWLPHSPTPAEAHDGPPVPRRHRQRPCGPGPASRPREPEHDCEVHEADPAAVGRGEREVELLIGERWPTPPAYARPYHVVPTPTPEEKP